MLLFPKNIFCFPGFIFHHIQYFRVSSTKFVALKIQFNSALSHHHDGQHFLFLIKAYQKFSLALLYIVVLFIDAGRFRSSL